MFFSATEETLEILNSLDVNKSDFINEYLSPSSPSFIVLLIF